MPWRFRRTLNIGPIRLTIEKTGIGISIGTRGVHIGRSPNGRIYISAGIPGTGLYWRKDLSAPQRNRSDTTGTDTDPLEHIPNPSDRREWQRWKQRYRAYMRQKQQQEGSNRDGTSHNT
mgnify:CR=1 FL=1